MVEQSQYASAATVPLIKYPSLRLPLPIQLPPDIHPLPDSVDPYFVYPFTLEPHLLTVESSRRATIAAHAARREAFLISKQGEKEMRKREALHRIAPGFDPQGVLVPMRAASSPENRNPNEGEHTNSVMDSLAEQLAALEYLNG